VGQGELAAVDLVVMNRSGALIIHDQKGREKERLAVVYGARLKVKDGHEVKPGQLLVEWDPYSFTIMTEENGQTSFKDILDGLLVETNRHRPLRRFPNSQHCVVLSSPTVGAFKQALLSTQGLPPLLPFVNCPG
jgi:DNA-directed RNA polymerase subunit beta'